MKETQSHRSVRIVRNKSGLSEVAVYMSVSKLMVCFGTKAADGPSDRDSRERQHYTQVDGESHSTQYRIPFRSLMRWRIGSSWKRKLAIV